MHFFTSLVILFVSLLASRVYALNITIAGLGVIPATEFLNSTDSNIASACTQQCSAGTTAIDGCTTDECLCDTSTITAITACQECMFTEVINLNVEPKDPRTGSATALTAYAAACLASADTTVDTTYITLTVPENWDGPFGVHANTVGTVFTVAVGLFLGAGCFTVLNTM